MYGYLNTLKEMEKFDVRADVPFNPEGEEVDAYYWEDYELYHGKRFAEIMEEVKKEEEDMLAHPEKYKVYTSTKELDALVKKLREGEQLEQSCRDHPLLGKYKDYREYHIHSDCLLIYRKHEDKLIYRAGTHRDLF